LREDGPRNHALGTWLERKRSGTMNTSMARDEREPRRFSAASHGGELRRDLVTRAIIVDLSLACEYKASC
jgi:hypothetical protein